DESEERPDEIMIQLFENGVKVDTAVVKGPKWTYAFNGLDKYDADGKEIVYTIDEEQVEGYETLINDHDVTNLRVGKTSIDIAKVWQDESDVERPKDIVVNLLANGVVSGEYKVSAQNDWTLTINDLAKYDNNGKEIAYTISKQDVPGYELNDITRTA